MRQVRALRGAAASAVAVVIAAVSHTIGGGTPPAPWLVLAVALLSWPVATALVGRRPSVLRTSAAVAAAQVLLHVAFAAVGDGAPYLAHDAHSAHAHAAMALSPAPEMAMPHLDPTMLLAHAVAAIVTTVLLVRGERMLRAVARGIRRLLTRPPIAAPRIVRPRTVAVTAPAPPIAVLFLSTLSRRGPPALAR